MESVYAKSNNSLVNDSDLIVFLLNRLEQLADQAEPLYKKAQKGKVNDRKQLLYLYGEVQIIGELFDMFDGSLTAGQKENLEKVKIRFPRATKEDDNTFLEGLAPAIVDENLKILEKQAGQLIKQTEELSRGNESVKAKLIRSALEVSKRYYLLDFFELTEIQDERKTLIAEKINNIPYMGMSINTENIFRLLANEAEPFSEKKKDEDIDEYIENPAVDEFIDQYELLMNEMVPLMQKMMEGGSEAQQDYLAMTNEIQALYENASTLLEQITPRQAARIQRIIERVTADINNLSRMDITDSKDNSTNEKEEIVSECSIILNQYESWVDRFINLYPKVKEGDLHAIEEMNGMTEELQAITDIMSDCSSGYSKEEIDRIQQMADKLSKLLSPDK